MSHPASPQHPSGALRVPRPAQRRWAPAEEALLRTLAASGLTARLIGLRMARSRKSILCKAELLGVALRDPVAAEPVTTPAGALSPPAAADVVPRGVERLHQEHNRIVLSPILLLSAAHAMARGGVVAGPGVACAGTVPARDVEQALERDLAFVHHVGYWSHYDARLRCSSWPFGAYRSGDDFARRAAAMGVLSTRAVSGAIALQRVRGEETWYRAAIVATVTERGRLPGDRRARCEIVVPRPAPRQQDGACEERWFDPAAGDRFVHWWEMRRGVELACLGRAA